MQLTREIWYWSVVIAAGIVVAWILATPARAETLVLCFTDLDRCEHCKRMHPLWERDSVQAALGDATRKTIDLGSAQYKPFAGGLQAKYGIRSVPTTLIYEAGGDGEPKLLRRADKAMDEAQLIRFLRGDQ